MTQRSPLIAVGVLALALALSGAGALRAQPADHPSLPPGHPAVTEAEAHSLQGQSHAWAASSHMHAFYDLSVATLSGGAGKPDLDAYEQKSFAIFRDFGASMGANPATMQDHLKLIPRQVAQIVKEDPQVLASYDNFVAATFGPQ